MEVTKTLHELLNIWAEVRRRIVAALSLTSDLPNHPFVLSQNFSSETETGLKNPRWMLEDQVGRIDSLTEKTKALNSLVRTLIYIILFLHLKSTVYVVACTCVH